MELRFIKVGNEYVNSASVEKLLVLDNDIYLATDAGSELAFVHEPDDSAMMRITRRLNEKAHDIIYIEAFANNDEGMLADDGASNLMYRKWLTHHERHEHKHGKRHKHK